MTKMDTEVLIKIENRLSAIETANQFELNHLSNIDQHLNKLNERTDKLEQKSQINEERSKDNRSLLYKVGIPFAIALILAMVASILGDLGIF